MKVFISFLIYLAFLTISYSQENKTDSCANSNYVFDVYIIHEYELGYLFFEQDNSSLRISLGLYLSSSEGNEDEKREFIDGEKYILNSTNKYKFDYHQINLRAQYLYRFYNSDLGESYFGIGPSLGYYLNNSNREYESDEIIVENEDIENRENSKINYSHFNDSMRLGISGLIGIRSYLTKSLSFFAESHINVYKSWLTRENESESEYNNDIENGNIWDSEEFSSVDGNSFGYDLTYIRVGLRLAL